MVKKVKAPKTYNPGKGRPKEHLAYLNQNEMNYLRMLNGGNMERGPRGLPSFAEESVAGPGGSKGGGGKSGGGSGASSGAGGQGNTTSGSQSTTGTKPAGFDRSQTMMTDANGVSYDYNGNVIKTDRNPAKSNSAASPNFPSSVNLDRQVQAQTQVKDAIQAVKNTPAIKSTAGTSGIKSLSVGPMGTQVSVGGAPKVSSPVSKPPEAKIGMSVPRGFYDGITTERENALREAQKQSERVSSGLFGRSVNDPRDVVSSPSRADVSEKFTPAERQAARDAVNPAKIASSIYSDPYGSASRAASGIASGVQALGNYMGDAYSAIGRGAMSGDPVEREDAAQKAAEAALNFGISGGVASIAAPRPANSLGAFVNPNMSPRVDMQRAAKFAEDMWNKYGKGLTPEQASDLNKYVAEQTRGLMSGDVSGVQRFAGNSVVEIAEPFDLKVSEIVPGMKYSDVFREGPLEHYVPQVKSVNVITDPAAFKRGSLGYYNPGPVRDPSAYTGLSGVLREYSDTLLRGGEPSRTVGGPVTSINSLDKAALSRAAGEPMTPQKLAAHEIGTHYLSNLSAGLYGDKRPVGPGDYAEAIMESNPGMTKGQALSIGREIYNKHIEEIAALGQEARVGLPGSVIGDPENLFSEYLKTRLPDARRSWTLRNQFNSKW